MCGQKEEETDKVGWPNNVKSETDFSDSTPWMKLLPLMVKLCSEPTECRTAGGREDVDSVFVTLMLGAQTLSKLMDSVSPDVELLR